MFFTTWPLFGAAGARLRRPSKTLKKTTLFFSIFFLTCSVINVRKHVGDDGAAVQWRCGVEGARGVALDLCRRLLFGTFYFL